MKELGKIKELESLQKKEIQAPSKKTIKGRKMG
jgi:hypothetical protein